MKKKYKAMILSCIDPRFQSKVFNYLKKRKLNGQYSSFTIAGSAVGVTHIKFKKWQKTFIENLETSIQIHKINKLIVINHKDCGAAKLVNVSKQFNDINENKIHRESFQRLKKIIIKKFPKLYYEFHIMTLKGSIKSFDA